MGQDLDVQRDCNRISAHWTPFDDPESDVVALTWCLGSREGICDIRSKREIDPSVTTIRTFLEEPLRDGKMLYVMVEATNGAGGITTRTSDGVTIDIYPPIIGIVNDGQYGDIDYLSGESDVKANWFGFDDKVSGIKHYDVALCDSRNTSDCPQPFVDVHLSANINITGIKSLYSAM